MAERITYTTEDDVIIVGDWTTAPTMLGAVVLLHMMPATRTSWAIVERELAKRGVASLAIDLRGHGDSTQTTDQQTLDYREFEDDEHQASILDVVGAVDWVRKRGLDRERIALAGASIGANLALQMLTDEPKLPGAVLLSPGADYHGVKALEDVQNVLPHQALYVVSSEDDTQSFADSRKLFDAAPTTNKVFVPYKNAGHGTNMFATDRKLIDNVCQWLADVIRA
jgi:alpha-beta hydrolase superfamily lysophospholipase